MEVKVYHAIAMKVLNVVYIKFTALYKKLYEVTVQNPSHRQRSKTICCNILRQAF